MWPIVKADFPLDIETTFRPDGVLDPNTGLIVVEVPPGGGLGLAAAPYRWQWRVSKVVVGRVRFWDDLETNPEEVVPMPPKQEGKVRVGPYVRRKAQKRASVVETLRDTPPTLQDGKLHSSIIEGLEKWPTDDEIPVSPACPESPQGQPEAKWPGWTEAERIQQLKDDFEVPAAPDTDDDSELSARVAATMEAVDKLDSLEETL